MGGMAVIGKLVSSPRGATYYWIERHANGDAPCIVFTHGIAVNHHAFDKQVPYFKRDYTVLTWDLPLHGRSRSYQDFSYAHAADELEAILQRERLTRVILVGVGIGGYVCQEYTARYPKKVQAFVGVGVMPFGNSFYSSGDMRQMTRVPMLVKRLPERLVHIRLAHARGQSNYGYHNALAMIEQMSKREIVNAFRQTFGERFARKEAVDFGCPVLLVVGALDYEGKFAEYCRKWSEQSGYPMHVISAAAHNANADNFDEFNDVVGKFLRRKVLHAQSE